MMQIKIKQKKKNTYFKFSKDFEFMLEKQPFGVYHIFQLTIMVYMQTLPNYRIYRLFNVIIFLCFNLKAFSQKKL